MTCSLLCIQLLSCLLQELVVWKRAMMVGGGSLCAILGAPQFGFPSAGPLACVTLAFVASVCWKTQGPVHSKVIKIYIVFKYCTGRTFSSVCILDPKIVTPNRLVAHGFANK